MRNCQNWPELRLTKKTKQRQHGRIFPLFLCAGLMLGACDPKAASNANFEKAIKQHLEGAYFCVVDWPPDPSWEPAQTMAQDLRNHGIIQVGRNELTEDGKKLLRINGWHAVRDKPMREPCIALGRIEFISVLNFTEPADAFGRKVSQVEWNFKLTDVPSWAPNSKGVAHLSKGTGMLGDRGYGEWFRTAVAGGTIKTKDTFILTGTGWVHERFIR